MSDINYYDFNLWFIKDSYKIIILIRVSQCMTNNNISIWTKKLVLLRYKENPNIAHESAHAQAREALKKYLHYFERVKTIFFYFI